LVGWKSLRRNALRHGDLIGGESPAFAEAADRRVAVARTDQTARQVVKFFTRKIEVKNYASGAVTA
jgi:hypothetical protein